MKDSEPHLLIRVTQATVAFTVVVLIGSASGGVLFMFPELFKKETTSEASFSDTPSDGWVAPRMINIPNDEQGKLIRYGRELIVNTAMYLGPNGKVKAMSNGMNCQNCHLNGGTKHFGNNFSAVASTYPKFRGRYGGIESVERRVNDCFRRSLNGDSLVSTSIEMRAIVAYIQWVGQDVEKGISPPGSGLVSVPFLDRAANPENGKVIYENKCAMCHGMNGEGMMNRDSSFWLNPPLWGEHSYNIGAGIHRLGRFAGFVKANMPWGVNSNAPALTDEEVWDIAAYVNSRPRPVMDLSLDWPDISTKPFDYPFGPFFDNFKEEQHKFGPFKPLEDAYAKLKQ